MQFILQLKIGNLLQQDPHSGAGFHAEPYQVAAVQQRRRQGGILCFPFQLGKTIQHEQIIPHERMA